MYTLKHPDSSPSFFDFLTIHTNLLRIPIHDKVLLFFCVSLKIFKCSSRKTKQAKLSRRLLKPVHSLNFIKPEDFFVLLHKQLYLRSTNQVSVLLCNWTVTALRCMHTAHCLAMTHCLCPINSSYNMGAIPVQEVVFTVCLEYV